MTLEIGKVIRLPSGILVKIVALDPTRPLKKAWTVLVLNYNPDTGECVGDAYEPKDLPTTVSDD